MRATIEKIYNTLIADPALAYINSWSLGGADHTRLVFPFVNVGAVEDAIEARTIGPGGKDESVFSVSLTFGVKSTIPELAYFGDATAKGILHIADDLRRACRGNDFGGAFTMPANVESVRIDLAQDAADWVWMGEVVIIGRRRETRIQP